MRDQDPNQDKDIKIAEMASKMCMVCHDADATEEEGVLALIQAATVAISEMNNCTWLEAFTIFEAHVQNVKRAVKIRERKQREN